MSNWMPGAATLLTTRDGGSMVGGPPRATEHVMVCPYTWSALQAARFLVAQGTESHLTLHPITGHIVQMIPAYRAARALANKSGGVQTNRQGKYNIQTEVVAMPNGYTKDVTEAGHIALAARAKWLDSLGVDRIWAGGEPPETYTQALGDRSVTRWLQFNGWFGHSQVPENLHWDPGPCDPSVMMGKAGVKGTLLVPKTTAKVGAEWYAPDNLSLSTIKALQAAVGVKADGIMGPATAKATQQWLGVKVDGYWGRNTITALQRKVGATQDGIWGPNTAAAVKRYFEDQRDKGDDLVVDGIFGANTIRALEKWLKLPVKGTWNSADVKALQRKLRVPADGIMGPVTIKALQRLVSTEADGIWGKNTTRALQRYLNRVI